jgi:precorrin-3B synthase
MKRGWCPGVHAPMPSGDGLLMRVKPFGGILSAAALRTLAVVAAGCGNGAVELTNRGNIQLRGLTPVTAPLAAAALVEAGLADPDPVREARRNVIAVPPCDDALVAAIEALLAETPGLPPKFCVAVGDARADVRVVDGRVFPHPHPARAAPAPPSPAMRERGFVSALERVVAADRALSRSAGEGRGEGEAVLLGLPFGQTDAAALLLLADLVTGVRTTPWRSFFLAGAHDLAAFAAAGFIVDPDDPRRSIAACAGAPACASASVPARADAAILAARGVRGVHISGCAKGCAHPGAATTLVGAGGSYGFVRHGRAGDRPSVTGLTIAQAAELLA